MKKLADYAFECEDKELGEITEEYYKLSTEKKLIEKELKLLGSSIKEILKNQNREKVDVNGLRITISTPDTSKFDNDLILNYINSKNFPQDLLNKITKISINEDGLTNAIIEGLIDLDELKKAAWKESKGTPRLLIKEVKKGDLDEA